MLFSPKRLIVHLEWDSKKMLFFLQGAVAKQIRDIPGLSRVNIFKLLCL